MTSDSAGPAAPPEALSAGARSVESPKARYGVRAVIVLCGVLWIAVLGWLVWTDSNPVIVNRTQILASPLVVQGTWVQAQPPRVQITRVWKGDLPREEVTIVGPTPVVIPSGSVLVPLTPADRTGATYQITHGELLNPTANHRDGIRAFVQPLVYPFNPGTQAQLEQLLH